MRLRFSLIFLALGLMISGCTEREVGSKKRPFAMYFVPAVDSQKVTKTADALTDYVSRFVSKRLYDKDTGFYVKSAIPASYIAVIEAFGTGKADFAAFNTFSYILAKDIKKYPIEAALAVVREGGEVKYKGAIFARVDSGIDSLEDLNGKKFAYSDPASTSGYILPKKLFRDKGIELNGTVFAQKHDNVITMVYQKQVDAGAAFYSPPSMKELNGKKVKVLRDARMRVETQFPDVEEKVKIIGFTEEIPNEPWVIRSDIYDDKDKNKKIKKAVVDALLAYIETPEGAKVLKDLYDLEGLVSVQDDDYNKIRQIVKESDFDLQNALNKK